MFLTVEWAKRWLPAIFLLLSIHLPWSTVYYAEAVGRTSGWYVTRCSFLWSECRLFFFPWGDLYFDLDATRAWLPAILVSSLIMLGGLAGLSGKNRTRKIGGFFGILGIFSYFLFVFPYSVVYTIISNSLDNPNNPWYLNPYFGISRMSYTPYLKLWFLSPGFFLALAGSLMLLSPIIRTGIERIRKRSSSSKQIIKEQLGTSNKKEGSLGE